MNEYDRFFELLNHYPFLKSYWSRGENECDIERLKNDASGILSKGESVLAAAMLSIWTHSGAHLPLDFSDLGALDEDARKPLIEWLREPFFP